jgi:nucleoside-diphosphate-sugar epimerase
MFFHFLKQNIMQAILGINGVVGGEIARVLREKNVEVVGISRRTHLGDWEHRSADVLNLESLQKAITGATVVYCCVGLEYKLSVWQSLWMPLIENVIVACLAQNARLVFIDNVYMYGFVEGAMTEKTPMNPTSEKGKVRKAVAEKILDAFKNRGLKGSIARAADFYGPNCEKSLLTEAVFNNFKKNKSAQWFGKLDKVHAFTFVPDIGSAAVVLGSDEKADGKVWHLPTASDAWTGQKIVDFVAPIMGKRPKVSAIGGFFMSLLGLFIPILKEFKEMMYQYNHDYVFSSDLFEKTFNMKPTSYEEGLTITANFYKN